MKWSPPLRRLLKNRVVCVSGCLVCLSWTMAGCSSVTTFAPALRSPEKSPGLVALSDQDGDAAIDSASLPAPVFDDLPAPPPVRAAATIQAPQPFSWRNEGSSAGQRSFQTLSCGKNGYRTLVVGSVGGHDPVALELIDRLARHLHDNSLILGGFETNLVRTLNPDGEANHNHVNQNGVYLNSAFPMSESSAANAANLQPEVKFLLSHIREYQPQRVIHLRTVQNRRGVIASGTAGKPVAAEAAGWLDMDYVGLSEKSHSGSLERFLAVRSDTQIVTVGVPAETPANAVWDRYRDTLLNLLLSENLQSRDVARRRSEPSAADRRTMKPGTQGSRP